jgi:hypothetical protein
VNCEGKESTYVLETIRTQRLFGISFRDGKGNDVIENIVTLRAQTHDFFLLPRPYTEERLLQIYLARLVNRASMRDCSSYDKPTPRVVYDLVQSPLHCDSKRLVCNQRRGVGTMTILRRTEPEVGQDGTPLGGVGLSISAQGSALYRRRRDELSGHSFYQGRQKEEVS